MAGATAAGEVSVWMDARRRQVWALVSDVTRIGEFSPETFEARWTRGSTGPEVGAYVQGPREAQRRRPTYWSPCQVTKCVPEQVFEFAVGTDDGDRQQLGLPARAATAAAPTVTEYFRLEPTSADAHLLDSCSGRCAAAPTSKGMRTTLERMKEVVES